MGVGESIRPPRTAADRIDFRPNDIRLRRPGPRQSRVHCYSAAAQKASFGQGSMMAQSSVPFFIVFISAVSPPWRSIHFFTVSG